MSQPVADATEIDLARHELAELNAITREIKSSPSPFRAQTVRGPCANCNSGWMSSLEVKTSRILKQLGGDAGEVTRDEWRTLSAWMLKNYFVMGVRADHFNRALDHGGKLRTHLIPSYGQAHALEERNWAEALALVSLGVGRHQASWPMFGFGTTNTTPPNVLPFVGALALGFPRIDAQFWLVNPVLPGATVRFPPGVAAVPSADFNWAVRPEGAPPDPQRVRVEYDPSVVARAIEMLPG